MWATHTESPELLHSSPSPAWEGKRRGNSEEQQLWLPQPGLFFLSSLEMGEPGPSQRGCPLSPEPARNPKNGTTKCTFCSFFYCGKGSASGEQGGKVCFVFKILKRKMFQEKGRGEEGRVSIWVHLYNIPSGAVVWLTSVGWAPGYRNLSPGSLAREPQETTTTLVLWERFKQGISSLEKKGTEHTQAITELGFVGFFFFNFSLLILQEEFFISN